MHGLFPSFTGYPKRLIIADCILVPGKGIKIRGEHHILIAWLPFLPKSDSFLIATLFLILGRPGMQILVLRVIVVQGCIC